MTILAVIVISSAAIRGLSAWLLKKRHRRSVEFDVEIRHTDGSVERRHVKFEFTESSSEPEIVKQVGEKFGIDPAVVGEALAHLSG